MQQLNLRVQVAGGYSADSPLKARITSSAPRIPLLTAPSIYPFQTNEVSVPTKCSLPTTSRNAFPLSLVNVPGIITGDGQPQIQGCLIHSCKMILTGSGAFTPTPLKTPLNCSSTILRFSVYDHLDQSLPLSPTTKQVMLYCPSSGEHVSREK